jgi:hypothetical protein
VLHVSAVSKGHAGRTRGDDHWWWLDDVDVLLGPLLAVRDANDGQATHSSGCKPEAGKTRSVAVPAFTDCGSWRGDAPFGELLLGIKVLPWPFSDPLNLRTFPA